MVTASKREDDAYSKWKAAPDDPDIQAQLYQLMLQHAKRVVISMLRAPDEVLAADAASRGWLAMASGKFAGDSAFSTWFHRLATNECLGAIRSRNNQHLVSTEDLNSEAFEGLTVSGSTQVAAAQVAELLEALEPADRQLLRESLVDGKSVAELSAVYGVPANTMKARIWRLKKAAREAVCGGPCN